MDICNGVTLREQILSLKCCKPLELLMCPGKRFRSFHTVDIGSLGQSAAKLLAVKVGGPPKKSAELCAIAFGPGLSTPRVESFSNFDSWQL